MRRRTWMILAAFAVAAVAAVVGAVIAVGLGGDDTARPTGTESVLRFQPAQERVSCGAGPAPVYVYLDDLAARPSPAQPDVSYGVAVFEFLLRYDPKIVRIAAPADVEINPALNQVDPDGDGLARSFFPISNIDDGAGRALVGGASLVGSSQGPADNLEEGLDPVAAGEPVLLMTIRFLPVGHGATALTITPETVPGPLFAEPGLLDPSGKRYEPVALKEASLTVEGGDCPAGPFATPRPTPEPTHTPFVPPTPTIPTPVQLTPTPASDTGRTDCPADWAGYRDPDDHFSLCYPADWQAISAPPQADFSTTLSLTRNYSLLTLYWKESSYFDAPDFQDRCAVAPEWRDKQQVNLTIAGRTAPACVGYETLHAPEAPVLRSTFAEIPIGAGEGYVVLFLTEAEGPAYRADRDAASLALQSLRLRE